MGNADSKLGFRKAVIELTTTTQPVSADDDAFWSQFWSTPTDGIADIFALIPSSEIRALREESPSNLTTLCYKAVHRLAYSAAGHNTTTKEHQATLNCVRLLTRLLPYIFEDADWRGFFWSTLPGGDFDSEWTGVARTADDAAKSSNGGERRPSANGTRPLAHTVLVSVAQLLFCPDFTVASPKKSTAGANSGVTEFDSCEFIWQSGVGFSQTVVQSKAYDQNRCELLRLLLVCFSEVIYVPTANSVISPSVNIDASSPRSSVAAADGIDQPYINRWVRLFTSTSNPHSLPLLCSLLNTVIAYNPSAGILPYNHLMFADSQEPLVVLCLHVLCACLDSHSHSRSISDTGGDDNNLFVNYMSRIHRDEDFDLILRGIVVLLNNPLTQTYLPGSAKRVRLHEELFVLFWRLCEVNKKFLFHTLKSSDVLDLLVPILYHINNARSDPGQYGIVHIGVFALLHLSGERNFGVRLNKPYSNRLPGLDVPLFTGNHADLLLLVFHRLMTSGGAGGGPNRLQPLYDCMLTILVNISPFIKSFSMTASSKLMHLIEVFSTPHFLLSAPSNHTLIFTLLEIVNNIVQYQFDGNANLIYTLIRRRSVFHQLLNMPTDESYINSIVAGKKTSDAVDNSNSVASVSNKEAAPHVCPAPSVTRMTERLPVNEDGVVDAGVDANMSRFTPSTSGAVDRPSPGVWTPTEEWLKMWKSKLPLQTIMRTLQVLVPQVEKICLERGLTDESEILKFLSNGTLVGLLPVPHALLVRKYQTNDDTEVWFRAYLWGVIYLRHDDPPIWYDTDVRMFSVH